MKGEWKDCALADVCTLQRGFDLPKRDRVLGHIPLMSSSGAIDFHNQAKVAGPGVVTGRSGSIGNVFYVDDDFWPLNTTLYVKDFHGNYPRFVYYLLSSFGLERFSSGAGVPTLNRNSVHNEMVSVPGTVEGQKRIDDILDEAFEGIDAAIANTEKNLANARELFESFLKQAFSNRGWPTKYLSEVAENLDRKRVPITKANRKSGNIPYYGASGVVDHVVDYLFDENLLLVSEESL
ncbi:restriction endonuclease subunit S [Marinobacter sp. G11]|uniref:restriction endonuclease subunit S n=1 Tax=Marinobacter sp. G11 TaxID=2903522 RepID=UPI001E2AF022|nr:restriction endonuclease subunit S [Marinobacter sp. G11]MCE0760091.1 restriction endonuclease subunit S [Marinobacter sp. G11]